ncbi:MAG: hypothetical protein KAT90_08350 [Gammaproteobacteria bacterium]|nr:hypothetical protein [Gammaproteobacteria bacterium]
MAGPHTRIVLLIILVMLSCRAWAETYDPLLIRAGSSIYPKIILLDKGLSEKTPDNEITITVVSTDQDSDVALQLMYLIKEKYMNGLGSNKLKVNVTTFNDFKGGSLATAYIVLQGSKEGYKNVISYASSHNRIVFSYSYTDFIKNSLISLLVKEKTYIYLNKSAVKLYNIKFMPVFYEIIKIIE